MNCKVRYAWNFGPLLSSSNELLTACASFLIVNGILVSSGTGLMMLQMVAYNTMTGSSLLVSLSLSYLQFDSGCQLKASAALLVVPNL